MSATLPEPPNEQLDHLSLIYQLSLHNGGEYGGRYGLKVRGLKYLYCYGNDTTSRKIERVKNQPFKSTLKVSEIFQKT